MKYGQSSSAQRRANTDDLLHLREMIGWRIYQCEGEQGGTTDAHQGRWWTVEVKHWHLPLPCASRLAQVVHSSLIGPHHLRPHVPRRGEGAGTFRRLAAAPESRTRLPRSRRVGRWGGGVCPWPRPQRAGCPR